MTLLQFKSMQKSILFLSSQLVQRYLLIKPIGSGISSYVGTYEYT